MLRKSKLRRFLLDFDFFFSPVRLDFGGILVCAYEFWVWSTMDVSVRASPYDSGSLDHSGSLRCPIALVLQGPKAAQGTQNDQP